MIGDHHQLPPVVQNVAYQKYANMEQSLFARLIRLGVPYVELDAQGRARADIAQLYNFCYRRLTDLPHVLAVPRFCLANAGFRYTFQFIDVPDFNGVGESTPSPYFYQVWSFVGRNSLTMICEFIIWFFQLLEPWRGGICGRAVYVHADYWLPRGTNFHHYHL